MYRISFLFTQGCLCRPYRENAWRQVVSIQCRLGAFLIPSYAERLPVAGFLYAITCGVQPHRQKEHSRFPRMLRK